MHAFDIDNVICIRKVAIYNYEIQKPVENIICKTVNNFVQMVQEVKKPGAVTTVTKHYCYTYIYVNAVNQGPTIHWLHALPQTYIYIRPIIDILYNII